MRSLLGPDENTFRHVLASERDKLNKSIPAERCFQPKKNDQGLLSVDSETLISPEESLAIKGSQYKTGTQNFKSPEFWEIYSLSVRSLVLIDKTITVFHDPIIITPPEIGNPSNPAHCLIDLSQVMNRIDAPEIITQIRKHAINRKVHIDMEKVFQLLEKMRKLSIPETEEGSTPAE
ncbi:MAG: hypothetical protein WC150_12805 [Bacteroidia bacterium]